jgi:hypothetical protein
MEAEILGKYEKVSVVFSVGLWSWRVVVRCLIPCKNIFPLGASKPKSA